LSNPVCTRESLISAAACFQGTVLTSQQQRAMKVYFLAAQLAAIGGTNYVSPNTLSSTLIFDARCKGTLYPDQLDAIKLAIEYNNANAAGAALSSNINTLMQPIACLKNVDNHMLDVTEIHLRCELGYGHAYPQ
jgi:hypothetical protein